MITSFNKMGSPAHYYKDVRGYLNRKLPQRWIGRTGKEDDELMRWPPRSPDLTPSGCFVKDTVFVLHSPIIARIFATVSPLLWLWSTVICWHARGTRWTVPWMSAVLPKVNTLSICEVCKKKLESFSIYQRKNYNDPLSSVFVVNFWNVSRTYE